MSETSVPADADACPNCEATVRADVPLEDAGDAADVFRACPECGASLRRRPLGGWVLAERDAEE